MSDSAPEADRTGALSGGYVRLKHALSTLALAALAHARRNRGADALFAYARRSRGGSAVSLAAVAAAAGMPERSARTILMRTGLFAPQDEGAAIALAAPFRRDAAYFYRQVARLREARRLLAARRSRGIAPEIWRGAALFNAGLFFECHEYLEDIWRAAAEPDRTFYHGLVQAAAGCYHLEKGNLHGARTLIGKAVEKLRPYGPARFGLDVAGLLKDLQRLLAGLERPSPSGPAGANPALRRNVSVRWKMC